MTVLARFIIVSLIAGWILGRAGRGRGFGIFGNTILGALGSLAGDFLFGFVGLPAHSFLPSLMSAVVGATFLLATFSFVRPARAAKESE